MLLGLLRVAVFIVFRAVVRVVIVAVTAKVAMVRHVVVLPFIFAASSALAGLATSSCVWLTCIVRSFTVFRRETANRETQNLTLRGWLLVIQDLFQKAVDVEFHGYASLFNIANTRGFEDEAGDAFHQLIVCKIFIILARGTRNLIRGVGNVIKVRWT